MPKIWLSLELRDVALRASWLTLAHLFRILLLFGISLLLARHLGPLGYGKLAVAVTAVVLIGSAAGLGLNAIILADFTVLSEERTTVVLRTSMLMKLAAGALAGVVAIVTTALIASGDRDTIILTAVAAPLLLIRSTESFEYWLQANRRTGIVAAARTAGVIAFAILTVGLVGVKAPLALFSLPLLAETAVIGGILTAPYLGWRSRPPARWSMQTAVSLLSRSWPLLLSVVALTAYQRVDQLMLAGFGNLSDVGIYTVASRISEAWYLLPTAIATAATPYLVSGSQRHGGAPITEDLIATLYATMTGIALIAAITTSIIATPMIELLYGVSYLPSAPVLAIHIWAGPFVFAGTLMSQLMIISGMQRSILYQHLAGAIANVALNALLIPRAGVVGAAWATLISYAIGWHLFAYLRPSTRGLALSAATSSALPVLLVVRAVVNRVKAHQRGGDGL